MFTHGIKMKATIYKAPNLKQETNSEEERVSIFLAGSIEQGNCADWQTILSKEIEKYD